jgi:hypothetical protein
MILSLGFVFLLFLLICEPLAPLADAHGIMMFAHDIREAQLFGCKRILEAGSENDGG